MLHTLHDVESKARSGGFTPRLVGFASPVDRSFFSDLLQVRGLGAKKAIRSLVIPISRFATAIEQGDTGLLSSLPGIGGRMAEKIVAELKGKVGHYAVLPEGEALAKRPEPERPDYQQEAISALLQLGYRGAEAAGMIDEAVKHNPDITEPDRLVRAVFKRGDGD
jgi:Holliday junction DNA helicase RuvA